MLHSMRRTFATLTSIFIFPTCATIAQVLFFSAIILPVTAHQACAAEAGEPVGLSRVDRYSYEVKHEVRWRSLDDELTFQTQQLWTFSLTRQPGSMTAKVLSIRAIHEGPDRTYRLTVPPEDASTTPVQHDALLGPLAAWVDVRIPLDLDDDGRIHSLDGSQLREAWLNSLPPGAQAPSAPQLEDQALAQWWREVLLRPPAESNATELVPLPAPLHGSVTRQWTGTTYSLSLPAEQPQLTVQLHQHPTPVELVVTDLTGSGRVDLNERGLIDQRRGELAWTLTGTAMTQPVSQYHTIVWRLLRTPIETLEAANNVEENEPGRRGR